MDRVTKDHTQLTAKAFPRADKKKVLTEYDRQQEAFRKNYERLRAERLAREASKSKEK